MAETKTPLQSSIQSNFDDFDTPHPIPQTKNNPLIKTLSSIHLGLTALTFLSAIAILATSAETLVTYNATNQGEEMWMLPLWPTDFDIRPTVALVACSVVILVASGMGLVVALLKSSSPSPLKSTLLTLTPPTISLLSSLISTTLFYASQTSPTTSSLHSWSCQWSAIPMGVSPHWGSLCKESQTGVYLMILVLVVQVLVVGCAVGGVVLGKRMMGGKGEEEMGMHGGERKGSPALS